MIDSRKRRLLVVSDYFVPHWTGLVKGIHTMTQGLSAELDITVLTVQYRPDLPLEENLGAVKLIRTPFLLQLSRACYSPQLVLRYIKEVRNADIVLLNSPCSNILPCAVIAALLGKRIVIFHQGDLILAKGLKNRIIEGVFSACTWVGMKLANAVSTYTQDYADNSSVLRPFLHKLKPLILPLDIPPVSGELPERLKPLVAVKEQGKVIFGFGGRFVAEKGFDVLLRAVPLLLERVPNAHFAFAGETNIFYEDFYQQLQPEIEKLQSSFTFLGLLNDQELSHYYEMIDFVTLPSRSDCFALFQAEACVRGRPSIVSDIPGARFLVRATGFGIVFEKENHVALAHALATAVERKDELQARHGEILKIFDDTTVYGNIRSVLLG